MIEYKLPDSMPTTVYHIRSFLLILQEESQFIDENFKKEGESNV